MAKLPKRENQKMKKRLTNHQNKIHPLAQQYTTLLVRAHRLVITNQAKDDLKKLSAIIIKENLQTGILHLFFGQTIADGYKHGAIHYYERYYSQIPTAIEKWLSAQLFDIDNSLVGSMFKEITLASTTVNTHLNKLSTLGTLHPASLHTAFFPAVHPAPFKGIVNALHTYYYPYPKVFTEIDTDIHDSTRSLLLWAIKTSRARMLVSLNDVQNFESLKKLQTIRHTEHQLKMLDAITQGYDDTVSNNLSSQNHFIPSINIQTKIHYDGVRFCSYETFLHLSDRNKIESLPFAATNILKQLNSDYLHHGLALSAKELTLFLKLQRSTLTSELMLTEESAEGFYKTALGYLLLQRYVADDQLQHIVRHHTMLNTEKNERKEWHYRLAKNDLPPRLQTRIKKMVFPFHEMYVVTLNHRKEFFNGLKPLYKELGYNFDGYFSCFAHLLLDASCNMKYIIQAYERFSYNQNYLRRYPFQEQKVHYTLDLKFLHDFYVVLHPIIVKFFHTLKQHKVKSEAKKVSNIILKSMLSYNLDTSSDITHLVKLLNALHTKLKKSILMQEEVLSKINKQSSLTSILALCEDRELQIDNIVLYTIKNVLHVEEHHLQMAANMLVKESYVDLCSELTDRTKYPLFHTPPQVKELVKKRFNFTVSVLPHNNPIALLGPSLSSVCIDFASIYHHQQLNPAFMNLCIQDNDQLILWGLLCRAYDHKSNKVVYILNNFQGSINNHRIRPRQVQHAVLDTLREFMEINQIDTILMKDQYFNTINLCEGLPPMQTLRNKILLDRSARLDFEVNSQGAVQQDKFYILDIPKDKS